MGGDPRARAAERVPEGYCATVWIHSFALDFEHFLDDENDRGERFVNLPVRYLSNVD